jgi:hypothetical protein
MILLIGCILIVNIDVFVTALSSSSSNPLGPTSRNIATQILQGTGTALIDLNQYNIPFEEAQEEWTAKYVQKTNEKKAQVFLRPKSETTLYADTVVIRCPRKERLGLELTELASRDDGLGITIITGLVAGGSAEQAEEAIFPGDSLAEVAVIRQKRSLAQGLEETESVEAIRTECLSYDATVDALASLPSPRNDGEEFYKLTVKRLRRKPKVTLKLQYPPSQNEPDTTIELFAGENLRYGMLLRGIKLNDPLAKRFDTKSSKYRNHHVERVRYAGAYTHNPFYFVTLILCRW